MRRTLFEKKSNLPPAARPEGAAFVDIHCHCLPDLDDGPGTLTESVALCRQLVADGCETVIATPHVLGPYENRNDAATIRRGASQLAETLAGQEIPLRVLPGAEVRVDERIAALLEAAELLTLADTGRWLLLEMPHETIINLLPLIEQLAASQVAVLLSHPERNSFLARQPAAVDSWLAAGAALQITAGSLLGNYGSAAKRAAWHFLDRTPALLVASDAHDCRDRRPRMTAAYSAIAATRGPDFARRLCVTNPALIAAGADLETDTAFDLEISQP